jgi:choline dehydrogenase-like flavoprotein
VEADVVIVGSGAGGGVTADILSDAGLHVVLVEEGPLRSSSDFRMREADAYPELYQESASRKTADKAINILQGRCVGGSTTVNWTSSFRTPPEVFDYWQRQFGLRQLSVESMSSWFAVMEHKLRVRAWDTPPNANNKVLAAGAEKLGIPIGAIKRNVKGCWNLGYCGMGCPTNAKQSMLLTTIPAALHRGASLYTRCGPSVCVSPAAASPPSTASPCKPTACIRPGGGCTCARGTSSLPVAPSAARRCCCAAAFPIRSGCSASAPSCIRW